MQLLSPEMLSFHIQMTCWALTEQQEKASKCNLYCFLFHLYLIRSNILEKRIFKKKSQNILRSKHFIALDFNIQKFKWNVYKKERTRWHFTKTSLMGVFVSSFQGPCGWLREETQRGHCPFLSFSSHLCKPDFHTYALYLCSSNCSWMHMHDDTHTHCSVCSQMTGHRHPTAAWLQDSEWVSLLSQPHSPVCFVSQAECLYGDLQDLIVCLSCLSDPSLAQLYVFLFVSMSFDFFPPNHVSVTEFSYSPKF